MAEKLLYIKYNWSKSDSKFTPAFDSSQLSNHQKNVSEVIDKFREILVHKLKPIKDCDGNFSIDKSHAEVHEILLDVVQYSFGNKIKEDIQEYARYYYYYYQKLVKLGRDEWLNKLIKEEQIIKEKEIHLMKLKSSKTKKIKSKQLNRQKIEYNTDQINKEENLKTQRPTEEIHSQYVNI